MSVSGYVVEPCPYCGKGTAVEHVRYDNCFIVRCLHCGYTSGHIASERGAIIEHNKLCRAIPKPDPDWKATCAKCIDGEIEPTHCEYYGEPNGCNSPVYGEHPTTEESSAVGDAAAMREALRRIKGLFRDIDLTIDCPENEAYAIAAKALAAPLRNCDVGTAEEQRSRFERFCDGHKYPSQDSEEGLPSLRVCDERSCPLCKYRSSDDRPCDAQFVWAQMPYAESEAGK